MSVAALPSTMPALQAARVPEASEGLGPDHDGDADDKGVASLAGMPSPAPNGMGASVDTRA